MKSRMSVLVWGASGHATTVADILKLNGCHVAGFLDDINESRYGDEHFGAKVLGGRDQIKELIEKGIKFFVVGIGDNVARMNLARLGQDEGLSLVTAIHPGAIVAKTASIGSGTVVAGGAVVNPLCKVGENVIINTSAVLDHECQLANGVHIGPGAILCGDVVVEEASFIGAGSVLRDKVTVGRRSIVGAGSTVLQSIPDNVVAVGSPAHIIKTI